MSSSIPMTACVFHVDIDAFFASVEELRNPRLCGRPVAVGNGVIASCNYEARRRGLSAGLPLHLARARCPGLVVIDGNQWIYRSFAERVFEICHAYAPAVETFLDEAYCDLSGTERLHGDPVAAAAALKARVRDATGLRVTVGIGSNRMIAKIASKAAKPDGLGRIPPGEEARAIEHLAVERLPGVGPRTAARLFLMNILTVADLRLLPRASLIAMFGKVGDALFDRARGIDTPVVRPREIPRTISRETAFHAETTADEEIEGMLYYLLERAAATARTLGIEARRIGVRIGTSTGAFEAGETRLVRPTNLEGELHEPARALRRRLHARRVALKRIGIVLSCFRIDGGLEQLEFDGGDRRLRDNRLAASLDAIRTRFGHAAIVAGPSIALIPLLRQDHRGFILRTPSLTK
ncbi:MAG: DNA polymerase IV [Planctomycetes bacterium]|nr:DNA polymerase IV [Planctomycetota bacterium]